MTRESAVIRPDVLVSSEIGLASSRSDPGMPPLSHQVRAEHSLLTAMVRGARWHRPISWTCNVPSSMAAGELEGAQKRT
jgi:hypothetical protein